MAIRIKRGDTWIQVFQWRQGTTPVNLTGCTASLQVRKKSAPAGSEAVLTATTATGELKIDGPDGNIQLRVNAPTMRLMSPGTYDVDLEVTFPGDSEVPDSEIVRSTDTFEIEIIKDITRLQ